MEKLKPCPFCGGEAAIDRKGTQRASMIIKCIDCGATNESGDVYGLTNPENYSWNTRTVGLSEEEIIRHALEAGFMLSTKMGQDIDKFMPMTDRETLVVFAKAILSAQGRKG